MDSALGGSSAADPFDAKFMHEVLWIPVTWNLCGLGLFYHVLHDAQAKYFQIDTWTSSTIEILYLKR